MKSFVLVIFAIGAMYIQTFAQNEREFTFKQGDSVYVMKRYIFCLLKSGPTRSQDSVEAAQIQQKHLNHIFNLVQQKKVVMAGPFDGETANRGILIFDVETVDEAVKLESEDPAVKAGRLVIEALPWWAAKGSVLP